MLTVTLTCCPHSVFMIVAPSCSAVLPATAVKQFSGNNLSQNDARVIQLSSLVKKTHIKEILYVSVVVVGQQAAWPGWGDYCFWAFVSCGEVSSSAHPIIKKKNALHHPLSLSLFFFSPSLFNGCDVDVRCLSSPCL